jgi:hypothetical protein
VTLNRVLEENRDKLFLADIPCWNKEADTEDIYKVQFSFV